MRSVTIYLISGASSLEFECPDEEAELMRNQLALAPDEPPMVWEFNGRMGKTCVVIAHVTAMSIAPSPPEETA